MDYISGTNKKVFLWIKRSSSFFLTIQNNGGTRINFPASPKPFPSQRGAPKPFKTIKAGSALSGGVVCMGKPEAMANPFP